MDEPSSVTSSETEDAQAYGGSYYGLKQLQHRAPSWPPTVDFNSANISSRKTERACPFLSEHVVRNSSALLSRSAMDEEGLLKRGRRGLSWALNFILLRDQSSFLRTASHCKCADLNIW